VSITPAPARAKVPAGGEASRWRAGPPRAGTPLGPARTYEVTNSVMFASSLVRNWMAASPRALLYLPLPPVIGPTCVP
jgi:hypothetical protein